MASFFKIQFYTISQRCNSMTQLPDENGACHG
jgi:hypothetical protein